jgi:hypothetical protein
MPPFPGLRPQRPALSKLFRKTQARRLTPGAPPSAFRYLPLKLRLQKVTGLPREGDKG